MRSKTPPCPDMHIYASYAAMSTCEQKARQCLVSGTAMRCVIKPCEQDLSLFSAHVMASLQSSDARLTCACSQGAQAAVRSVVETVRLTAIPGGLGLQGSKYP